MTSGAHGLEDRIEEFKGRLLVMQIIHLAMVMGVIVFGTVVFVLTRGRMTYELAFRNPVSFVAGGLAMVNIVAASVLHKVFFGFGGMPPDAGAALERYRTMVLIRAAMLEGAALFAAVATLVTSNILPAYVLILCAGALILRRPSLGECIRLVRGALAQNRAAR